MAERPSSRDDESADEDDDDLLCEQVAGGCYMCKLPAYHEGEHAIAILSVGRAHRHSPSQACADGSETHSVIRRSATMEEPRSKRSLEASGGGGSVGGAGRHQGRQRVAYAGCDVSKGGAGRNDDNDDDDEEEEEEEEEEGAQAEAAAARAAGPGVREFLHALDTRRAVIAC